MAVWILIPFLLALLSTTGLFLPVNVSAEEIFDVRQHLSTSTRYDVATKVNSNAFMTSTVPDHCSAIHLNLVARHGTRSPTKKRIKELDQLALRLDSLLKVTKEMLEDNNNREYLQKIPPWLWGWQSPWKGKEKGGELLIQGEEELFHLGIRIRERFPQLFGEEYHPDVFNIRATQIPRASASAVAFGMGLFYGKGSLGPGKHRAFSVISESRASDIWLRFHDTCETYKEYRKSQAPYMDKLKSPILDEVSSSLRYRYHLNFTKQDVSSLWFLCKQEASLLNITSQACDLFNSHEVSLLEWADDLEVFILKGYGKGVNYHMGVPLLQDVIRSMEQAIAAKEENQKNYEKAKLHFAHAETLIPFTCLLGLFIEESEFIQIQQDQPLDLPPKPPQKRNWIGSIVAPFAGNNMLVLYRCSSIADSTALTGDAKSNYFVQVLHNEASVLIPGCGGTDFCPFDIFKEKIINPHMKHDFETVCTTKPEPSPSRLETQSGSCIAKLSKFLRGLLFLEGSKTNAHDQEEL